MHKILSVIIYIFALIGFILVAGYVAMRLGWTNTEGIIDNQENYFQNQSTNWSQGDEWAILKEAILRDKEDITKAAQVAGVSPRLLVAQLIVEQLRLYHSDRELFKTAFAPLKVLGNQSQFSWGVMGIKQETAIQIEKRLGEIGKEGVLAFTTSDPGQERFERLTNEKSRYYSYLYAALYLKELEMEWQKAGFPIGDKPGILSTLYNIGFENSKPKADPQIGGAEIEINKTTYSFGGLALSFYNSDELKEFTY